MSFWGKGRGSASGKVLGFKSRSSPVDCGGCVSPVDGFICLFIYLLYTSASIVCWFDGAFVYVKEKTD